MKAATAINDDLAFVMVLITLLVLVKLRLEFILSPASESRIHRSADIVLWNEYLAHMSLSSMVKTVTAFESAVS